MEYHVPCRCGKPVAVKAEEAGTTIRCDCGESVTVPSLSRLRATAGLGSYESGAIAAIRRMLDEGTLPWGETCAASGQPTQDVIQVHVQCERLHVPKDRTKLAFVFALVFGPWAILLAMAGKQREVMGRDTVVTVPLRVGREFHYSLARRGRQRRLRRLLRTVPIYARLLDEYPKATVKVETTAADAERSRT